MDFKQLVNTAPSFKIGGVELLNLPKNTTQAEANISVRVTYYRPSFNPQTKPIVSHRVTLYPEGPAITIPFFTPALGNASPARVLPASPQPPTVYSDNSELNKIFSPIPHQTFKEQADEKWAQYANGRRKKLNARKDISIPQESGIPKPNPLIKKTTTPYQKIPHHIGHMGKRKVFSYTPTNFGIN